MNSIVVIDDDLVILEVFKRHFKTVGFDVHVSSVGTEGLNAVVQLNPDCVILDIDMNDASGYDICRSIRTFSNVPIIFLSNYSEEEYRIKGFEAGSNDYVVKPFSIKEMEYRINLRINESKIIKTKQEPYMESYGMLLVNKSALSVICKGKELILTQIEFSILMLLINNRPQPLSREKIYDKIWKLPSIDNTHTVHVHISSLRKKLNSLNTDHEYIQTVWGMGYRFVT